MKPKGGKWPMTIGIKAVPETRAMLDKLSKYENKKIKPLFEELLWSYIKQNIDLHKEKIESIDADIRNTKTMMDELSTSLERTLAKADREMIKSRIETAERYYGILFVRKNNHLAHAVEYQKMLDGYHKE